LGKAIIAVEQGAEAMATTEERMRILKMIQEGKITAEEGAQLLAALRESSAGGRKGGAAPSKKNLKGWIRVRVTDMNTGKTKVNVNLPLNLVDAGMNIATQFVPEMRLNDLGEAIQNASMTGKIIDVIDEEDGEHVEIFIE
jgi:hypothetical protein